MIRYVKNGSGPKIISDNFRRIHGIATLINELKKASSLNLKISILNCMY